MAMEPAGEMWSVVTESPSRARQRASSMSGGSDASRDMPAKKVGCRTYVETSSQAKRSPVGMSSAFQRSSPAYTSEYLARNISVFTELRTVSLISSWLGQMSRRNTSSPRSFVPSGSA